MLIRPIKFEDLDGNEVTENFHFNLSKPELIEMEVEHEGGFKFMIEKIIGTNDRKGLIEQFKKLILMTYGVRSDDGKRFVKSDQLREEFTQTPAYEVLFMELATDDGAAIAFLNGVLPRDMRGTVDQVAKEMASAAPAGPTPPTPPQTQSSGV